MKNAKSTVSQIPDSKPQTPDSLVEIGQVVGSFGLKGQIKVRPATDFLSRFQKGKRILIQDQWYDIEKMIIHKERPLVKLKGVEKIEQAEKLKWAMISAFGRPELGEDEYLLDDLIGLEVYDQDLKLLGKVSEILPYPAHDLLVIGELMVPLIKEFVKDVNLDSGKITVHLIPGMLPE